MKEYTEAEAHVVHFSGMGALPDTRGVSRDWAWLRDQEGKPVEGLPEPETQYGLTRYEWADGSAIVTSEKDWFFGFHRSWMDDREVEFAVADSGENIPAEFTDPATLGMEDMVRSKGEPRPCVPASQESELERNGNDEEPQPETAAAEDTAALPPGAERVASEEARRPAGEPLDEVLNAFGDRDGSEEVLDGSTAGSAAAGEQQVPDTEVGRPETGSESPPGLPEVLSDWDRLMYAAIEFGRLWEAGRREDTAGVRRRAARLRAILDYGEEEGG